MAPYSVSWIAFGRTVTASIFFSLRRSREYGGTDALEDYNDAIGTFRELRKALDEYFAKVAGVERG